MSTHPSTRSEPSERSAVADGITERVDAVSFLDERVRREAIPVAESRAAQPIEPGRYLEVQGPGETLLVRLERDATRIYVQSADQERFEVIDVATRQTIDTFTLSEPNKHVRALAYEVDPQHRSMVLVARTATRHVDRFDIGPPVFIQYDLKEHKIVRTIPWTADPEPNYYFVDLRFSPDGKLLYVFSHEILVRDATTLQQIQSWDLSLPNEPGLGRFDLGWMDEWNDEPGYFTALFTTEDPVQKRKLLIVGRVNLGERTIDFFPIGPAPERGEVSFALAPGRKQKSQPVPLHRQDQLRPQ